MKLITYYDCTIKPNDDDEHQVYKMKIPFWLKMLRFFGGVLVFTAACWVFYFCTSAIIDYFWG